MDKLHRNRHLHLVVQPWNRPRATHPRPSEDSYSLRSSARPATSFCGSHESSPCGSATAHDLQRQARNLGEGKRCPREPDRHQPEQLKGLLRVDPGAGPGDLSPQKSLKQPTPKELLVIGIFFPGTPNSTARFEYRSSVDPKSWHVRDNPCRNPSKSYPHGAPGGRQRHPRPSQLWRGRSRLPGMPAALRNLG